MKKRALGFTLIELMIVVVIIGILAAIAVPAYTEYVQRGKITEATSMLADLRVRLEQYYQDNRDYGSTATAGTNGCGVAMPTGAAAQYFTFTCRWRVNGDPPAGAAHDASADASNQSFLVAATGVAAQGMTGFSFTVDHQNNKVTTGFPGATGLPKSCWMLRKGDAC